MGIGLRPQKTREMVVLIHNKTEKQIEIEAFTKKNGRGFAEPSEVCVTTRW